MPRPVFLQSSIMLLVTVGHLAHGSPFNFCSTFPNVTKPSHGIRDLMSWYLVRAYATPFIYSKTIYIFNESTLCQLQNHNLKQVECTLSETRKNDTGQIIHCSTIVSGNDFFSYLNFSGSVGWMRSSNCSDTAPITKYCTAKFPNGTNGYFNVKLIQQQVKMISSMNLYFGHLYTTRAFVSKHRYDVANQHISVTLIKGEAEGVEGSKVSCVEYLDDCKQLCLLGFGQCLSCTKRMKIDHWKEILQWTENAMVIPQSLSTQIPESVNLIWCSPYPNPNIQDETGPWDKPVLVDLRYTNPVPILLVSGVIRDQMFLVTYDFSRLLQNIKIYQMSKNELASGVATQEGIDTINKPPTELRNELLFIPKELTHRFRSPYLLIDFCRNWISKEYYILATCLHCSNCTCMYLYEELVAKISLIYQAEPNNELQQIECNPFKDIVVATQNKSLNIYDLVVLHVTSFNKPQVIDLNSTCLPFKAATGGISGRGALAIDWATNGSVLVVGGNGELWALNLEFEGECYAKKVRALSKSNSSDVTHLAADWHHFYWISNVREQSNQPHLNVMVRKGYNIDIQEVKKLNMGHFSSQPKACIKLRLKMPFCGPHRTEGFSKIEGIRATAPDARRWPDAEIYFPQVENLAVTMINKNTAQLSLTMNWTSKFLSLRPPIQVITKYKVYQGGDLHRGCNVESKDCIVLQAAIASRNATFKQTIPLLEPGQKHYIEVNVSAEDGWRYKEGTERSTIRNMTFEVPPKSVNGTLAKDAVNVDSNMVLVLAVTLTVVLLFSLAVFSYAIFRYLRHIKPLQYLPRINKDDLEKVRDLGTGYFGAVWEATLQEKGRKTTVAVKVLHENADEGAMKSFLEEAIILGYLNHKNIVKLRGICLNSESNMIVLEFINGGSLNRRLTDHSADASEWQDAAINICEACIYLEKKGYIHRDIRSSNILVQLRNDDNKFSHAVLADFGLAKDRGAQMEPYTTNQPTFPIHYSAPECFKGQFSTASDVYMFGILIWEMFSYGEIPHASVSNDDLAVKIQDKNFRPSQPDTCGDEIYKMMQQCWDEEPKERPNFKDMLPMLQQMSWEDNESKSASKDKPSSLIPISDCPGHSAASPPHNGRSITIHAYQRNAVTTSSNFTLKHAY